MVPESKLLNVMHGKNSLKIGVLCLSIHSSATGAAINHERSAQPRRSRPV